MGRFSGILIVAVAAAILVSGCGIPSARISARGGLLYLDGGVGTNQVGGNVQGKASAEDLGLDDPEVAFQPKAEMDWGGLNLSLDGFGVGYSGNGTATARLGIGNRPPIELGAQVKTDLDLLYLMLKATYDLVPSDVIDVGIGLGGGIVDYDLSVQEILGIGTFETEETLPVIYPVIRVGTLLGPVRIAGYLGGLSLSVSGNKIKYLDGELYAGVRLWGTDSRIQGWISLGYRYIDFEYQYDSGISEVELEARITGPYLSLEITF